MGDNTETDGKKTDQVILTCDSRSLALIFYNEDSLLFPRLHINGSTPAGNWAMIAG